MTPDGPNRGAADPPSGEDHLRSARTDNPTSDPPYRRLHTAPGPLARPVIRGQPGKSSKFRSATAMVSAASRQHRLPRWVIRTSENQSTPLAALCP